MSGKVQFRAGFMFAVINDIGGKTIERLYVYLK